MTLLALMVMRAPAAALWAVPLSVPLMVREAALA